MTWIELDLRWNDTGVRNCPVCGKLVTRRAWEFDDEGAPLQVCEPDCQQLYESYYREAHGRPGGGGLM